MSLNITISINVDVNISNIDEELIVVINVNELFNMKMIIDKFASIANSTIITFLNILIQLLKFEIVQ